MVGVRGRKVSTITLEEATSRQREVSQDYIDLFNFVS